MAQVTAFTAERMQEIEDTTVVGGLVDTSGHLFLNTRAGAEIDAGNVMGPVGPAGQDADPQLATRVSTIEQTAATILTRQRVVRVRDVLTGGGLRKVGNGWINWTGNFRTMSSGMDDQVPSGYFNIAFPPDGTVIPVIGHPTVTSITVAASKITVTSLSGYCALYYDLPLGATSASQPGRFHLVDYLSGPIEIPPTWILIAVRDIDPFQPEWTWGDGMRQDWWHNFGLTSGWINYGVGYNVAGWRRLSTGEIKCRGLITSGTVGIMTTADSGRVGPENSEIHIVWAGNASSRVDVGTDGNLALITYTSGGSNAFISLEGITWFPTGA
jgi:hypothetical protein